MASIIPHTRPLYCWKNIFRELRLQKQFKRSLVTVQRGPIQKLDFPPNLPQRYWSQLPARLRPDKGWCRRPTCFVHTNGPPGKRKITIHEPPPSAAAVCKDPVSIVQSSQMPLLDPTGARQRLFDPLNRDGVKVGDVLLATFKTGEPFSGVVMSIKLRGVDTSVLLRNHLTRIGTEMSIKVFSPLVQSMEVAQKAVKRKRRARLYYLRKPKHDVGSVEKVVDQYLRQRALLTGGKLGSQYGSRRPTVKGKK
jgi:large subunit ribosomal protein L19